MDHFCFERLLDHKKPNLPENTANKEVHLSVCTRAETETHASHQFADYKSKIFTESDDIEAHLKRSPK